MLEAYWHPAGMENAFSGTPRIQLIGIEANHPQAFDLPTILVVWQAHPAVHAALLKDPHLRGDEMADVYASILPEDFRARFQRLKDCYDSVSGAMHSANASTEVSPFADTRS